MFMYLNENQVLLKNLVKCVSDTYGGKELGVSDVEQLINSALNV